MSKPIIIVRITPFVDDEKNQKQVEKDLAEIVNRQRESGVIVLPNYAKYEGFMTVEEEEDGDKS